MIGDIVRRAAWLLGILALAGAPIWQQALAGEDGGERNEIKIKEVSVTFDDVNHGGKDTLTVIGENFHGRGTLCVMLYAQDLSSDKMMGALEVLSSSATQIVAHCLGAISDHACVDYDYTLVVARTILKPRGDDCADIHPVSADLLDLTIGDVGPVGPKSDTGPQRPPGDSAPPSRGVTGYSQHEGPIANRPWLTPDAPLVYTSCHESLGGPVTGGEFVIEHTFPDSGRTTEITFCCSPVGDEFPRWEDGCLEK